jgi:hypothetical protein
MSFISFNERPNPGKLTKIWDVVNASNQSNLGIIAYYPAWRKYVFQPQGETIFDAVCLTDVLSFIQLNKDARQ